MTTLLEAAQQALEAWQTATYGHPSHHKATLLAMTALRAALAQQDEPVEPVAWADRIAFESAMNNGKGCDVWPTAGDYVARTGRAVIRLFTAPPQQAEPVQEPVGEAGLFTLAHLWAQQAYWKGLGRPCDIDGARGAFEQALKAYTAPPQRLPLTEEEIDKIFKHLCNTVGASYKTITRATERAHEIGGKDD